MQEYGLALRASVLGHSGEIGDADHANKITFSNATAAHVNRLKVELGHVAQRIKVTGDPRPARSAALGASVLTAGLGRTLNGELPTWKH